MEPIDRLPSTYRDWGVGSTYGGQAVISDELRARVVIWPPPSTCPVALRARIRSCRVARRLPWLLNLEGAGNENHCSRCLSIIRPNRHSGKWETPDVRRPAGERSGPLRSRSMPIRKPMPGATARLMINGSRSDMSMSLIFAPRKATMSQNSFLGQPANLSHGC